MRPARALVLALAASGFASPVVAQSTGQTAAQLEARCSQLVAYFDRFGAGRSNNSDGRRNHTRMGAKIDCAEGRYAEGVATMEALLRRKKFTPPPAGPNELDEDP